MIDLKTGGRVELSPGRVVVIPPHSQREFLTVLGRTLYEFLVYDEVQPGEDPSDRIHLLITDWKGERRGWLMNVEDALILIQGLSTCCRVVMERGLPLGPER